MNKNILDLTNIKYILYIIIIKIYDFFKILKNIFKKEKNKIFSEMTKNNDRKIFDNIKYK